MSFLQIGNQNTNAFLDFSDENLSRDEALATYLQISVAESDYLKKADAASQYLTAALASETYLSKIDAATTYLTQSNAASIYLTQDDAADDYLTKSTANTDYLKKADAATTYLTQSTANTDYLKKTDAATTYLTQSNAASTYLTQNDAADDYLTRSTANTDYLKKTDAVTTYLTQSNAASTYLSQTNATSTYLTQSNAASTYLTQSNAATTYLSQSNAAATYLTQSTANTDYLKKTDAATTYLTQSNAASTYLSQSNAAATYLTQSNAVSTYLTQTDANNTYGRLAGSNSWTGSNTFSGTFNVNATNTIQTANNVTVSSTSSKTLISSSNTNVLISTITLGPYQKRKMHFSTPISVYRAGTSPGFTVTDTLTSISCDLLINGTYSTALTVTTNNTLPITKTIYNPNAIVTNYNYNQYFTNAYVAFTPTENLTNNTIYTLYFRLVYSSTGAPPTTTYGYYLNTDISEFSATGFIIAQSPTGVGYESANYSTTYDGINYNSSGVLFSNEFITRNTFTNNLESTILNTSSLQVNSYTIPNYDSGWFQVSANSFYYKNHNLNWSFPFPPIIRIFYCSQPDPIIPDVTNDPLTNVYEIGINHISGNYGNPTNTAYGITSINHVTKNTILINTAVDGIMYARGGNIIINQSTGYYRIFMYK
jgi:hypothetical protein